MRIREAAGIFVAALPSVLFCLSGGEMMPAFAAAIVVHELAHLLLLRLLHGRLLSFGAAPFGLCMVFDASTLSLGGEAAVSAAGSAANLLSAGVAFGLIRLCPRFYDALWQYFAISLLLALINLLPLRLLDGGRLLVLAIAAWKDPDTAERVLCGVTAVFSFALFLFSSYLLLTGESGFYLLLFSLYLLVANAQGTVFSKTENFREFSRI